MESKELLERSRHKNKTTSREFIQLIFKNFQECHGDRLGYDDPAVIGGIGFLDKLPVTVIGIEKGHDLASNMQVNFGQAYPEGYRKALRLMKQGEKFNRPIVTFINTPGAFCGVDAESRGQGIAIADNLLFLADVKVPVVAIIIGEGGSGGALALALGDKVWVLEFSFYAILSPEGFAAILYKDATKAQEAAKLMQLSPEELLQGQVVDKIIPETSGKRNLTSAEVAEIIQKQLIDEISQLQKLSPEELVEKRYERFRKF